MGCGYLTFTSFGRNMVTVKRVAALIAMFVLLCACSGTSKRIPSRGGGGTFSTPSPLASADAARMQQALVGAVPAAASDIRASTWAREICARMNVSGQTQVELQDFVRAEFPHIPITVAQAAQVIAELRPVCVLG
jgi:hypothetical protein